MTAQDYIQHKLQSLKQPLLLEKPVKHQALADAIFKLVMSKRFRKYSVSPQYVEHIKSAIWLNIQNRDPIQFTLVCGGYKLWRLEEAPEVDWAELFALMYYADWLKGVCAIYEPGAWLDFFSDDIIVPRINNISPSDTASYRQTFQDLLAFIRPFIPANCKMTLTRVADLYKSDKEFEADLEASVVKLKGSLDGGLPQLNDQQRATLELNVRPGDTQTDPLWREKVKLLHDSFINISRRIPYHSVPTKIKVNPQPNAKSTTIAVGTTKSSVVKFWIGAGGLKRKGDDFSQLIMSPSQLDATAVSFESINIEGLTGKNFSKIRVI